VYDPDFVQIKDTDFKKGIVEVDVPSQLLPTASSSGGAFAGVTFRTNRKTKPYIVKKIPI
jgi:hypothetical protein